MNCLRQILTLLVFQTLTLTASAQAPYFDLATFKEIIEGAQIPKDSAESEEDRIALTTQRLQDFFTSTSFAFNESISHSIVRNGELLVEIIRDLRLKFQVFHPKAVQITDPKFGVDLIPNSIFMRALMKVQTAALRDITETAQKVLNVMAYADRNESVSAGILYHHCIMAAAVGVNNSNCIKDNQIRLSNDLAVVAKFERAYMISYRISRLAFTKFHDEIRLLEDHSVLQSAIEIQLHIERNPEMMRYSKGAITPEQFQQMTFFKVSQIESIPECLELRAQRKAIKDIFNSQALCTTGTIFGFDTCFRQHTEENRRKVTVPSLGLEFASFFFQSPINEERNSDYKFLRLKSVCPVDPRYHYATN